jgi:hypothetical protein
MTKVICTVPGFWSRLLFEELFKRITFMELEDLLPSPYDHPLVRICSQINPFQTPISHFVDNKVVSIPAMKACRGNALL